MPEGICCNGAANAVAERANTADSNELDIVLEERNTSFTFGRSYHPYMILKGWVTSIPADARNRIDNGHAHWTKGVTSRTEPSQGQARGCDSTGDVD